MGEVNVKETVRAYMAGRQMTQEDFAQALTQSLRNTGVSRVSVSNWLNGRWDPDTDFLLTCLVVYEDWRADFAVDCLCSKLPEVFDRRIDGRLMLLTNRVASWESGQGEPDDATLFRD